MKWRGEKISTAEIGWYVLSLTVALIVAVRFGWPGLIGGGAGWVLCEGLVQVQAHAIRQRRLDRARRRPVDLASYTILVTQERFGRDRVIATIPPVADNDQEVQG
jgi:hypothetical protein